MPTDSSKEVQHYTKEDVLHKLCELAWRVVDGGHYIPMAILLGLAIILIAFWRMEPQDVGPTFRTCLDLLSGKIVLVVLFVVFEGATLILWQIDRASKLREIKRLGDEKSKYAHQPAIRRHTSSEYDWPIAEVEGEQSPP